MKHLFYLVILCISITSFAQETTNTKKEISITTYSVTINTLDGFDTIDWESIPKMFKYNKPETIVKLEFSFKQDATLLSEKKVTEFTIAIQGKSKEIDSLVIRAKKIFTKTSKLLN
ncbi:MAG: hypothetical protein COB81_08890 [Flavobacteriaceae bacterium]|nr:MAG: hypothetical protein COB81_08890 [Flavobacteriaceae bacterium]